MIAAVAGGAYAVAGALGVELTGNGGLFVSTIALLVGLKTAIEAARVRLHGFGELHRGSNVRRLGRHALLAVPVVGGVVVVTAFVQRVIAFEFAQGGGMTDPTVMIAAALALALVAVVSQSAVEFYRSLRRERPRREDPT